MNSYPAELLAQLSPVMFVAGLDSPATTPEKSKTQDPFTTLTLRLREALINQKKAAIWQPEKSKTFQVILVDRAVRFPPRKLVSPDDLGHSAAHSPLSPLTPSSPLHPDGLIAPIWIRKHTTLLPSVFVLFMRLFEFQPPPSGSPLDLPDTERDRQREHDERHHDTDLAAEIALRKKDTNERGIKLTVVLIASRKMLDDAGLDTRLTYIRRQSGLDSRAALFVLSPVSPNELGDFIKSLQQALYEPAIEYYTNHSKRVRRKRNRHAQTTSSYPNPSVGSSASARPLRPEGWTVRYEYKMACFAEFRGEDELALKHYQDAYEMLIIMFGSTAILPPRTKRWAEAKVLVDCINVKIAKLYLYNNEHSLALAHHAKHMRTLGDFSRGWGIGEETFEFWSWMARQHRILAELIEQGTRTALTIPTHLPIVTSSALNSALATNSLSSLTGTLSGKVGIAADLDGLRSLGLNPTHALQHPGFYYYMAAQCTEMRRERFLAALEAESAEQNPAPSPGFINEKKVDHLVIILELYTKAYEAFKNHTSSQDQQEGQGRLTLWIAHRIAQTYFQSGKVDTAVRFFERIAETYRKEKWGSTLRPLLGMWYKCAQELGDRERCVKLLVEMMGYGVEEGEKPDKLQQDLLALLKNTPAPNPDQAIVVDLTGSESMFDTSVVFWTREVKVKEPAVFQLSLAAPSDMTISSLPIASLEIHFAASSGTIPSVLIRHSPLDTDNAKSAVRKLELGQIGQDDHKETIQLETDLRWEPGTTIVFSGTLFSKVPTSLKISQLVVSLVEESWRIEIAFDPCAVPRVSSKWLFFVDPPKFINVSRDEFTSVNVRHQPHNIHLSVQHNVPAYVDEDYPIILDIANLDDRELDVHIDVLLQPTEVDAVNSITLDDEHSSSLIKGVHLGVLAPGTNAVKTLLLKSTGAPGDRMIDISVRSRLSPSSSEEPSELEDVSELLQTIDIPTVEGVQFDFDVVYQRSVAEKLGLGDLKRYDGDFWDDTDGGEAVVTARMECMGPWSVEVESVILERRDNEQAKVLYCTADQDNGEKFFSEYVPGDTLTEICGISVAPSEDFGYPQEAIVGPGEYRVSWRRLQIDGKKGGQSTSVFPLPFLRPPFDELIALLDVAPQAKLHQPTDLTLTVRNQQPKRSASITVQLEPDPSDAFVVAGIRSGRLPVLLPGDEHKVSWKLIPIECGYVHVPKIKVLDRRNVGSSGQDPEGEPVKIVDIRIEHRRVGEDTVEEKRMGIAPVLVLP